MLISTNYSYASAEISLTPPSIERTNVFSINGNSVVLVDPNNKQADLINLKTNKILSISNDANPILYLEVIKNPQKIVLLKKVSNNKITKTVFSFTGDVLSKTEIPLSTQTTMGHIIVWVAPTASVNERIMVQSDNSFNLYQYPWKNPSVSYNASVVDPSYESVSVEDWAFEGYPNLAIKYRASGIMSDSYFLKTINLYSKKAFLFKDFNTDFRFKYSGGNLAVFTSYQYQDVPAHVVQPKPSESQQFYHLINIASGNKSSVLKGEFKEETDISGWKTEFINNQLFVGDLATHTWSLYAQNGDPILKNQVWPKDGTTKFLNYSSNLQTAYFLYYVSGKAVIIPFSINKNIN